MKKLWKKNCIIKAVWNTSRMRPYIRQFGSSSGVAPRSRAAGSNDVQEAEDIVQEVLIRLWENRRHYQDITCLRSFVYTMIRNQSLNLIRNRKRSSQHFHLLPEEEENNFFNILVEEESNRLLFNAINTLAPQSAAIIQLSLQGLKNEEIARELSISENTVKVLKYRSLKKLRQLLHHRIFNILAFYI